MLTFVKRAATPLLILMILALPTAAQAEEPSVEAVNPFIPLMLALGVILISARVGGSLARLVHQPRVFGQLLTGVLLGPTVLDMLNWGVFHGIDLHETIYELAELGVLLLMFNIGLEVHIRELLRVGRVALLAGFFGAVAPVLLGALVVALFGYSADRALFTGVTLAATSVSISAQVLLELGVLRTKVGNALLATALVDDVLAILMVSLAVAFSAPNTTGGGDALLVIVRMVVYIAGALAVAWFVVPPVFTWMNERSELVQSYGLATYGFVLALLFGWAAEELGGVAPITGAFVAGVGLSRITNEGLKRSIEEVTAGMAYVLLIPVFFINVGLQTDLGAFTLSALPLAGLLLVSAALSKLIGVAAGAQLGGFGREPAIQLGVCMISRGEVGLIIASLGITAGVFDPNSELFASLFLVILLTTVLTPPLVRWTFQRESVARSERVGGV